MINTYSDIVENSLFYQTRITVIPQTATIMNIVKADPNRRVLHIYLDPQGALATPNWVFINNQLTAMYANYNGAMELNVDWYTHGPLVTMAFGLAAGAAAGTLTVCESSLSPRMGKDVSNDARINPATIAKVSNLIQQRRGRGSNTKSNR